MESKNVNKFPIKVACGIMATDRPSKAGQVHSLQAKSSLSERRGHSLALLSKSFSTPRTYAGIYILRVEPSRGAQVAERHHLAATTLESDFLATSNSRRDINEWVGGRYHCANRIPCGPTNIRKAGQVPNPLALNIWQQVQEAGAGGSGGAFPAKIEVEQYARAASETQRCLMYHVWLWKGPEYVQNSRQKLILANYRYPLYGLEGTMAQNLTITATPVLPHGSDTQEMPKCDFSSEVNRYTVERRTPAALNKAVSRLQYRHFMVRRRRILIVEDQGFAVVKRQSTAPSVTFADTFAWRGGYVDAAGYSTTLFPRHVAPSATKTGGSWTHHSRGSRQPPSRYAIPCVGRVCRQCLA